MKKLSVFLFLAMVLFSLVSCANKNDPEAVISVNFNTEVYEAIFRSPFDYTLTDGQKEKGFISVEKKNDKVAVYKIKRKDYDAYISELVASKKAVFDAYNDGSNPLIKSVSYNDDLTEITIAVDKLDYENESYENGSDYLKIRNCISGCGGQASLYHSYSTGSFNKCEITVVDSATGEVLETISYPEALLEK